MLLPLPLGTCQVAEFWEAALGAAALNTVCPGPSSRWEALCMPWNQSSKQRETRC